ncbi:hypothetical protein DVH26_30090 [Paenibacillus sp. H1-7]|nr:hypothetical protein DVH26_30090 [Paenibacillus sp. H1-7]
MISIFRRKKKQTEDRPHLEQLMDDNSAFLDMLAPDSIQEELDHLRLGRNYVRVLAVAHYANDVLINWLSGLHETSGNISLSHHIAPRSSEGMITSLNRAIIELKARMNEPKIQPKDAIRLQKELEDAEVLLDNLTSGRNQKIFDQHMYILLQARSLKELERLTSTVKAKCGRNLKAIIPNTRMLDAFTSALPIRSNDLPEMTYRNFDGEALSSLFPFDEAEIFADRGVVKGKNLKTHSVVVVDHDQLINRNEVVIATSGGGKSTYIWGDMMRRWIQGTIIRTIDPKAEFGRKFERLGGIWVKISPTSGDIINPFEIMNSSIMLDEDGNPVAVSLLHQKIARLKTMFTLMYKSLVNQQVELALLEKAIVETYRRKGIEWGTDFSRLKSTDFPIMSDLYRTIGHLIETDRTYETLSGFYQVLYPYVEGSYSKAFNGYTNVDLSNDLINFDIYDLRSESDLRQVAMYNILTFLTDDATMDRTKVKQIYVDEAHILADPKNPTAMEFLSSMYKLIRSFQGGVTSATQQVGDFLSAVDGSRNHGEAVILNSVTKLYLPMTAQEIQDIMNKTSEKFSEAEQRLLVVEDAEKHKNAGKGIYVVGSKKVHIQVELTQEELRLWDSRWYRQKYGEDPEEQPLYGLKREEVFG